MKSVPVSRLKARLSEYLRAVKGGERLLITDRGRAAAMLVPPPAEEQLESELADLVEKGLIRLGTGKIPDGFWDLPRAPDPEGLALKALLEERREGW
jgi:prevent-host-death family protein